MRRRSALLVPVFVLACLAVVSTGRDAAAAEPPATAPFDLRDGDRVIFLGATLIEREQKYGYWETVLTAAFPDRNVTFRNLGWDGDTVWAESRGIFDPPAAGYARMIEQIKGLKPTVIFLAYGNNESFAGPEGVDPFVKQYGKLIDDLTKVSAERVRFVILLPLRAHKASRQRFDPAPLNARLAPYSAAISDLAQRRGILQVDLNEPPGSQETGTLADSPLLVDGMHWSGPGYEHLSARLRKELDLPGNSAANPAPKADVEKLREAIVAKNELYFHSWRPQNVTYLFGFRKHEQGQNAKETAEFEKLVAEKEAEIAKLRKN